MLLSFTIVCTKRPYPVLYAHISRNKLLQFNLLFWIISVFFRFFLSLSLVSLWSHAWPSASDSWLKSVTIWRQNNWKSETFTPIFQCFSMENFGYGGKKAHASIKYTNFCWFFFRVAFNWLSNGKGKNQIHLNAVWLSLCYYIISWGSGSCFWSIRQNKRVQRVINEKLLML